MDGQRSSLDAVGSDLPTLERAFRLQETAAAAGLDWPEAADVWSRINEELAEAKAASEDLTVLASRIAARKADKADADSAHELLTDELGELLFAVVDVCRMLGVDPDQALSRANGIFKACFKQLEGQARAEGRMIGLGTPGALKRLWDQTKRVQRETASPPHIIWKGVGRNPGPAEAGEAKKAARA